MAICNRLVGVARSVSALAVRPFPANLRGARAPAVGDAWIRALSSLAAAAGKEKQIGKRANLSEDDPTKLPEKIKVTAAAGKGKLAVANDGNGAITSADFVMFTRRLDELFSMMDALTEKLQKRNAKLFDRLTNNIGSDGSSKEEVFCKEEMTNTSSSLPSSSNILSQSLNVWLSDLSSIKGRHAILWNINCCPVPDDIHPKDVVDNIIFAVRMHLKIKGPIDIVSAYGDCCIIPLSLATVKRIWIRRKNGADKVILKDMTSFALENNIPSSVLLISDVKVERAMNALKERGHTVIHVSNNAQCEIGKSDFPNSYARILEWDWPSLAHGRGLEA